MTALIERAHAGDGEFSLAERALYSACEFRAAAAARALNGHLALIGRDGLRYVALVYTAIGAQEAANLLLAAYGDLGATTSARARAARIMLLESQLTASADPLDRLLARFAGEITKTEHAASLSWEHSWASPHADA